MKAKLPVVSAPLETTTVLDAMNATPGDKVPPETVVVPFTVVATLGDHVIAPFTVRFPRMGWVYEAQVFVPLVPLKVRFQY